MQQISAGVVVARLLAMHALRMFFTVAGLALLVGCSTSPLSRIDANRAKYESWPLEVQQAILNGEAIKGMTPEQVEMAMGRPSEIVSRAARQGDDEVWIYRKSALGSSILQNTGVAVGGVGVSTSTGGRRATPEEREVVFTQGVVSRSDSGK